MAWTWFNEGGAYLTFTLIGNLLTTSSIVINLCDLDSGSVQTNICILDDIATLIMLVLA